MFHLRYDHQTKKILCNTSCLPSKRDANGRQRLLPKQTPRATHPNVSKSRTTVCYVVYAFDLSFIAFRFACSWSRLLSLAFTGSNQAYRAISTSQLNALLHLHLWPIDVVVYHGPQGYLVLRGASRLDAFSGYPVRT